MTQVTGTANAGGTFAIPHDAPSPDAPELTFFDELVALCVKYVNAEAVLPDVVLPSGGDSGDVLQLNVRADNNGQANLTGVGVDRIEFVVNDESVLSAPIEE